MLIANVAVKVLDFVMRSCVVNILAERRERFSYIGGVPRVIPLVNRRLLLKAILWKLVISVFNLPV